MKNMTSQYAHDLDAVLRFPLSKAVSVFLVKWNDGISTASTIQTHFRLTVSTLVRFGARVIALVMFVQKILNVKFVVHKCGVLSK